MVLDLSEAVTYHYNEFPPASLNCPVFLAPGGQAIGASYESLVIANYERS